MCLWLVDRTVPYLRALVIGQSHWSLSPVLLARSPLFDARLAVVAVVADEVAYGSSVPRVYGMCRYVFQMKSHFCYMTG